MGVLSKVKATTVQKFTSGSGTYTTPAGCRWIKIKMVGGGGGGGGGGTSGSTSGGAGGNSTFDTITAGGGAGGTLSSGTVNGGGGSGGTITGSPNLISMGGSGGEDGIKVLGAVYQSALGGISVFGGLGVHYGSNFNASSALLNSGAGGDGVPPNANVYGGGSGGSGAYIEHIITSPSSTYSYSVGVRGERGLGGDGSNKGGYGGSGVIIVEEYYN